MADSWADWPYHADRLGNPKRCKVEDEHKNAPQMCLVATSPVPSRGNKINMVHKWVDWRHHPGRLGGPHCFRAEDELNSEKILFLAGKSCCFVNSATRLLLLFFLSSVPTKKNMQC